MKKRYILIPLVIIIVLALAYLFVIKNSFCFDKGGSMIYFEKDYYLSHFLEFNNKSGTLVIIPEEQIVAKYSESASCYDKGSYFIKLGGKLVKVSKERYDPFITDYPSENLLVQKKFFGPSGIFDVSSDKYLCNDYLREIVYVGDCLNLTAS